MHHPGAPDVAELVGVAVQQQEGPADGRDLPLNARRRPHQLHAERHPHAAVEVQLVGVIRLHLAGEKERNTYRPRLKATYAPLMHALFLEFPRLYSDQLSQRLIYHLMLRNLLITSLSYFKLCMFFFLFFS